MIEDPRRQVFGALLMHAFLRWESLVTLIVTLILFLFVGNINLLGAQLPAWLWFIFGAIAQSALIISTVTDPEEAEEALAREFEGKYDLSRIRNRVARERISKALEYRRNMLKLVQKHRGAMRINLRQTVLDINEWIGHMHELAEHIDAFESNELVERDRKEVPLKIKKTMQRIELEKDPRTRGDLEAQLKQLEQQKLNLDATVNSVKRAEIQLESTLSSLGTVYAQMSLLGTKEVDSAKAQRLRLEIQDEVASLQDTIDAMDEVQMQSLRLR